MNQVDIHRSRVRMPTIDSSEAFVPSPEGFGTAQRMPMLTHYWSIARRRKWVIIGAIFGTMLAGLIMTLLMTPLYTANATIEIQRETRNFTRVEGVEGENSSVDLEFYETQYGLLRARSLAELVATSLRVYDDPEFFAMFGAAEAAEWFAEGRVRQGASTREERIQTASDILLDNFHVTPIRLSRLVQIGFTSPDPNFSKRVVDAWGAHFIQATLGRRFDATSYARNFLEERLAQLRARIEESERRLVDYAAQQGIVNLPATTPAAGEGSATGERSLAADDLAAFNRELARATAERVQAQSRLDAPRGAVTEALQNQAISGMRERRAQLAADHARMMVQFEQDYPPARAVQEQINQLDRSIVREESRVQQTLHETYQAALGRENALRLRVSDLTDRVLDLRRRSIQYNIYQRDADTNRELYNALLQRYKEIGVAGGVGVNNISIVDEAELPERPSSPRLLLNLLLAMFGGLAIGIGAAFAIEQIDEGVGDPGEVEETLGVPLLGTVPRVSGDPIQALKDRKSQVSEAYLSLHTSLTFSTDHGVPRSIAVTSSRPAEGKTTTSYALAQALARAGRKALLIDGDMRSPSVHHIFELKNRAGLSNYLSGSNEIDNLIQATPDDAIFVMTAGPQPPSAAELFSSDRIDTLMEELRERFDHIVIDAPPVMGLADAPMIANRVEGMVFVIESHNTKRSMARVAIRRLLSANAQMLGVVLTKFDVKRAHYGYGYDYGYGYEYGHDDVSAARKEK